MDLHVGLTIHRRGIHLGLLGGDGGVAGDHLGHDSAKSFNAKRQGGDVQQQDVLDLTGQHTALNRGTNGHHFIWVNGLVGVLAGNALDQLKHRRNAGGATHHHDFIEFSRGELGVLKGLLHRHPTAINKFGGQLLKLGPGEGEVEVLRALRGGRNKRQVDFALGSA